MALTIVLILFSVLALVIGLLLSRTSPSGGLSSLNGQDLEIFKKTKDRGWIKGLQVLMFLLTIVMILIIIFYRVS
ncbi:preprotein translocase subunit SecG [Ureaplasma urealyticum]|uniref:Preprotein translocase subunit SecG n=3 Tax=Ureaplasma urealyticum TaxID=2130 RepID=A0AAP9D770_UREUR|nr:preprotein translocase subunit SecG [Ureaplasma urealyticum]EDX54183.1 conserved domain protein [Ureaplasma urealyticum serovar 9 str. ATCC 33175]ACI60278.1 preprotein translocase, SecG subunit [Ureaplasma urealyticum serovar 10 str. ATCC 33699]EDT49891.1 conserved domain protein [Ureaplasma urealyticum serovar 13 str. ATCC 33698]EDU06413.1 conserved domain protein [Ureaplasma urealyticum serovar 5 str. ATCC 27817]EDU56756.1 conserved domain protein [Ureaplasma urealyticum serovar 7 str. AT